jgi:hypothetical protein
MIRNPFIRGRGLLTSLVGAASILAMCALAPAAYAQEEMGFFGYGARLGGSVDPDQLTVGGYVKLGKMTQMFSFRPSVDLGFGDNLFTVAGNVDAQVDFVDIEGTYKPFVGGGLGLIYYNAEGDYGGGDDSDTEIGVNLYGGVERAFGSYNRGYAEFRIGIDDLPDFKFTFGYGFY